jgi:two-component system heavy metal sensor histidine kinase CusS
MSSSSVPDRSGIGRWPFGRPPSIALRMTAWYVLSAFAMVLVATSLLYWVLVNGMYQEDRHDLTDNLQNAILLLGVSRGSGLPGSIPFEQSRTQHRADIYVRVIDGNGRTLTQTPGMAEQIRSPTQEELRAISMHGSDVRQIISRAGEPFLTLIAPIPGPRADGRPRFIEVAMDRAHDEYLLARYRERLWLVLGFSLVLCSGVGYLIARGGMRPIERIGSKAERIRATTLHERIAVAGLPSELRGLAETFNGMLDRLEESFRHISQFSDDVAHELRTPINNLRGEIEVALGKARSAEDYRDVLGSCFEECTRISRLIRTLLFLARSDTASDALQREVVDVGEELATVGAFYEAAASEAGVRLRVGSASDLRAEVDRTLFQQAIGNLISNALAHTPAGGSVELAAADDERGILITVRDTGRGIAPDHLPHVFERFYRAEGARTGSQQNVGLGLAVVKSIVSRHGGRLEIESRVGEGTEVRLIFPHPVEALAGRAELTIS